jgi:hypothetical protein
MPLPPELKSSWTDSLLSGDYSQGQGSLRQRVLSPNTEGYTYTYCCLGVLCDLLAKQGKGQWISGAQYDHFAINEVLSFDEAPNIDSMFIPSIIADEFELDRDTQLYLSRLNDGNSHETTFELQPPQPPVSFKEIALFIKENL